MRPARARDALELGREAYASTAWREAFTRLAVADAEAALEPDDLERLATAAGPAVLEPPPPEFAQALAGIVGNQSAMDRFVRVTAGVTSPAEKFEPVGAGESAA